VDGSGFAVHIVSAAELGQRFANCDVSLHHLSRLILQVVFDGETIWTGSPAGNPFGTSFNDVAFKVPVAFAMRPSEVSEQSKSAEPVMPSSGSTSADGERSSFLMVSFAWTGVSAVSSG